MVKEIYVSASSEEVAKTVAMSGINSFRLLDIDSEVISVTDLPRNGINL
jgi:hypothetical protein